jgi:hypothetical protein
MENGMMFNLCGNEVFLTLLCSKKSSRTSKSRSNKARIKKAKSRKAYVKTENAVSSWLFTVWENGAFLSVNLLR